MKLSASVEYAARVLVSLARLPPGESATADALSRRENIPRAYVDQIFQRLRRALIVESHRGARGGYVLARPPAAITVGMTVRAVEGVIFEDTCGRYTEGEHQCSHLSGCNIRPVWQRLTALVEEFLERHTLADLLAEEPRPAPCGAHGRRADGGKGEVPRPAPRPAVAPSGRTWEVP